ncbi:Ribokinase [Commensalibacter sp. Nvir]|uniref:ribokinase n=1 Tax=Commensalibacter sp. Nvir TaxID=3069817 RepID=UPI002D2236C8|nr:Ribokinase [Commensalibacter sp. Nvir]
MSTDVFVIGSLNYDILIKQDRLPKLGETYYGNKLSMMPGGKGANQAVQCAKLGLSVKMLGCVGNDSFGDELIHSFHVNHIDTQYIKRKNTTGVGVVNILNNGDYYSTIIKGANYALHVNDVCNHFFTGNPLVILQSEIPSDVVNYAVQQAYEFKCPILLNNAPARSIRKDILKKVNYLVVNETEASYMTNTLVDSVETAFTAARQLKEKIISIVFITLGDKGSIMYDGKRIKHFSAVQCEHIVDTTGAGDSWIGAIAWAILKGYNMDDGVNFASHVSAYTIRNYGGHNSFPTLKDVNPAISVTKFK